MRRNIPPRLLVIREHPSESTKLVPGDSPVLGEKAPKSGPTADLDIGVSGSAYWDHT